MNKQHIKRLIRALEIRKEQLEAKFTDKKTKYEIHKMHHLRDIFTTLSVLKEENNGIIEKLLANMPGEQDRPE